MARLKGDFCLEGTAGSWYERVVDAASADSVVEEDMMRVGWFINSHYPLIIKHVKKYS